MTASPSPQDPRFDFQPTPLAGVWRIERQPRGDARGFFSRLYCAQAFRPLGLVQPLAQINESFTRLEGTVRGAHFQHAPHAEHKLVTCLKGRILDFAIDLRRGSPTFLHWWSCELSGPSSTSLLIPPGCAHGFQTLEPDCHLLYLHSQAHAPEAEGGIHLLDPALRPGPIHLPLPVGDMSARDRSFAPLPPDFEGLDV